MRDSSYAGSGGWLWSCSGSVGALTAAVRVGVQGGLIVDIGAEEIGDQA
jgi:hypothetical protein